LASIGAGIGCILWFDILKLTRWNPSSCKS
jgi:hypothetical protein